MKEDLKVLQDFLIKCVYEVYDNSLSTEKAREITRLSNSMCEVAKLKQNKGLDND